MVARSAVVSCCAVSLLSFVASFDAIANQLVRLLPIFFIFFQFFICKFVFLGEAPFPNPMYAHNPHKQPYNAQYEMTPSQPQTTSCKNEKKKFNFDFNLNLFC